VDAEHALDMQFAEGIGVRTRDLLFVQPDYGFLLASYIR
jgi:RecA/RadA recombinase